MLNQALARTYQAAARPASPATPSPPTAAPVIVPVPAPVPAPVATVTAPAPRTPSDTSGSAVGSKRRRMDDAQATATTPAPKRATSASGSSSSSSSATNGPAPTRSSVAPRPTVRFSDLGGIESCLQVRPAQTRYKTAWLIDRHASVLSLFWWVGEQDVRELIEYPLTHPEIYVHLGVEPPRCVAALLLHMPGSGRSSLTSLTRCVGIGAFFCMARRAAARRCSPMPLPGCVGDRPAVGLSTSTLTRLWAGGRKDLGLPFLKISAPEIVSGMSGESEQRVRDLFAEAKVGLPSPSHLYLGVYVYAMADSSRARVCVYV
jgi:ribosome biogenesis ATPase